jgi:hypothetical protein
MQQMGLNVPSIKIFYISQTSFPYCRPGVGPPMSGDVSGNVTRYRPP